MKSTETLHQAAKDDYDLQRQAPLPDEKDKLRTSVTEMLGETPNLFHGRYRANANRLETKLKHAEATKDEKGFLERIHENRRYHTQSKIDRIQKKIDASGNGFVSRYINMHRRQTVNNLTYKNKVTSTKIGELQKKRLDKPEHLKMKIDALVTKKIAAKRRKAERIILREKHGIDPKKRMERINKLANLTPQQKKEIVREAILLVRKENIQRGLLDPDYEVDTTADTREMGEQYERTI